MVSEHKTETTSKKSLTVHLKFGKQLSEDSFWCLNEQSF